MGVRIQRFLLISKHYEFTFDSLLVRGDGGALDTNIMLENSIGGVESDLIVGGVTVRQTQIVVKTFELRSKNNCKKLISFIKNFQGQIFTLR
jgi:hypothetical protein